MGGADAPLQEDAFREVFFSARDGLRLHARVYGPSGHGLPVVCLPGLTRNSRDFHALAMQLAAGPAARRVVTFDYRGRGRSAFDRNWRNYNVATEAGDVVAGLAALGIAHAAFIGTSRGGLIVHHLAAARPGLLRAVVLNDIGPVVEPDGLAQIRTYLENAPAPADFGQAADYLKAANGRSFPALEDDDWARMSRAIYRETDGRLVADYDRALLRTLEAIDFNRPLPSIWHQFRGLADLPLLTIRGQHSTLLSTGTVAEMRRIHPGMEAVTVEGQGHPPLLESGELPTMIADFLDRAERTAP